jgi:hypothetical protein
MIERDPLDAHLDEDFVLEIVHGLRTAAEVAAAVEHARTCPSCDRMLRLLAGDRERLRARAATALATGATADAGTRRAGAGLLRRRGALVSVLAAAAAIAIVTGVVLMREPAPRPNAPSLALPAPLEIVHLRTPEEQDDLPRLERAIAAYRRADWRQAATLLEKPFAAARLEPLRRLYRASALLELGRTDEARVVLEPVARTSLPEPYAEWREWARLHNSGEPGSEARADSLVRALADRPGPLQKNARALLEATAASPGSG